MAATFSTVAELRDSIVRSGHADPEWAAKMLHKVPKMPVVKDRKAYLVERAKGQRVLDIGCTGPISDEIRKVAKEYRGVDKQASNGVTAVDLDVDPGGLPAIEVDIVFASEVLEHLSNPGRFLEALHEKYGAGPDICISVPNAGSFGMRGDLEMVHRDHVAWYSYTTLNRLLTRYGFSIKHACWYNGDAKMPHRAEGIIVVVT